MQRKEKYISLLWIYICHLTFIELKNFKIKSYLYKFFEMRLLLVIILLACVSLTEAQQLSVKSFRKLENDLSARGSEGRTDQNGDRCAIIKIVTTESGFDFDPDALGSMGSIQKKGEIWLYVPYGARRLTIRHAQLGMLRDYAYPERIEKAGVYELVLTTGRVETVVHEMVDMDYLVIRPDPAEAQVYIDEVYESGKGGVVQKFVSWGKHTYRVEHPLYHTEAGQVEVSSSGKKELAIKLRPAFGSVEINSFPESGAEVYIDGEQVGVTPYRGDRLKSGEHRIRVLQAMYQPSEKVVTVRDNETSVVSLELQPNFGLLTFTSDPSSEIWVNNELKGQGSWSGRLNAGNYLLEVRRERHRSVRQTLTVKAGEKRTVALDSPSPIYGMLNITSSPEDALIRLNGQEYGRTPALLRDILIGTYTLELKKEGGARVSQLITVDEGKVLPVHLTLSSSRSVTLQTDREGDILYVDEKRVGVSPQTLDLSYGIYTIRAERGELRMERQLEVTETGGESIVTLDFGLLLQIRWSSSVTPKQKEILRRLVGNMVKVNGGRFKMGGTSEQGNDVSDDEKPVHEVTLSDYYIGKYEVRQSEWEAVMGNNPSGFKGADLPVECVSWSDCHKFIQRLNALTGLGFKLPTEAQWEYAARGGRLSKGYKYSGSNDLEEVGWYASNSGGCAHPVAQKRPNELGLYDMSGNVWEWCEDWYGGYRVTSQSDPLGAASGSSRVSRGGSWGGGAGGCRVSIRYDDVPRSCNNCLGFRLVY